MRILVLGAGGMAGHVIARYFKEHQFTVDTLSGHTRYNTDTTLLDVQNTDRLKKFLASANYNVIINCIGLLVKESENHKAKAIYLNAFLPRFLEEYFKESDTKIIHISTNGVFSGKNRPYHENTPYDAESFYGRTKALGEIDNSKDLTIRTSIIGPELHSTGKSLFHWFSMQTDEVSGFASSKWSGVTTLELAKAIESAIAQNVTGIYHLVPNSTISKYELLQHFATILNRSITIKPIKGDLQDMSIINTRKDFDYRLPSYKTMLEQMKKWMKDHKELYEHYEI